jgi:hypothetical protein
MKKSQPLIEQLRLFLIIEGKFLTKSKKILTPTVTKLEQLRYFWQNTTNDKRTRRDVKN